ncbi:glycosyltransferase family 4 protein [Halomonadaceae bacterium KBTZ08]
MKIAFDARSVKNPFGGLGRYTGTLLNNVLARSKEYDHFFVIIDEKESLTNNPFLKRAKDSNKENITFVRSSSRIVSIKQQITISLLIKKLNVDVYFYPHFDPPLLINTPTLFVLHDFTPFVLPYFIKKQKLLKKIYIKTLISLALAAPNKHAFAVSNATRQDAKKYLFGNASKNIDVIGEAAFPPIENDEKIRPEIKRLAATRFLFYIGNRRPHKNIKLAIEIFLKLSEQFGYTGNFILAGSPKNYGADLESHTNQNDSIKFIGTITDAELDYLYSNSDGLLFLSDYEGFGLPVVEAGIRGKKIITSGKGSLKEVAPPWACFLDTSESDITSLAETTSQYLSSAPPLFSEVEKYTKKFSWTDAADKVLKKFEEIRQKKPT